MDSRSSLDPRNIPLKRPIVPISPRLIVPHNPAAPAWILATEALVRYPIMSILRIIVAQLSGDTAQSVDFVH
jgi:hypothetical protein